MIQGKSREEIIALMEAAEQFQKELEEYLKNYKGELSITLSRHTVNKYGMVISSMIEYLYSYHTVTGFEEIKFGMISSKFYYDFESNTQEGMSRKRVLNMIKGYFEFIRDTYGVQNTALMKKIASAKL